MYMSKDVRIRGYFPKPKGVREHNPLRNTAVVRLQQSTRKQLSDECSLMSNI